MPRRGGHRALVVLFASALLGSLAAGSVAPVPPSAALGSGDTLTVVIHLTQKKGPDGPWSIEPYEVNVTAGASVLFEVHNDGTDFHDLMLGDPLNVMTPLIAPTRSANLGPVMANLSGGEPSLTVPYWCTVPGHKQLGMDGKLVITAAENTTAPNATAPRGADGGALGSGAAVAVLAAGAAVAVAAVAGFAYITSRGKRAHR